MKNFLLTLSFVIFSSSSFAIGNFNSETGVLVIRNLSIDGTSTYDNVKLQLNLATGNFTILDTTPNPIEPELPKTFAKYPIVIYISDDYDLQIGFMGCILTATDLELRQHQVTCKTDVVSLKSDEEISMFGGKLIDNLGNEYFRQTTVVALDKPNAGAASFKTLQGIPVSVMYVFNGIDFETSSISGFKLSFHKRETPILINPGFRVELTLPQFN